MFKRVETSGYILEGKNGSLYLNEYEWNLMSSALEIHELLESGEAVCFDLSDPYLLYDKFLNLDRPLETLHAFLNSVKRLTTPVEENLIYGFESYLLSIN